LTAASMTAASDSMIWEALVSSIGDTSGEKVAPGAGVAAPPIHAK
jgi:hypothetical protein